MRNYPPLVVGAPAGVLGSVVVAPVPEAGEFSSTGGGIVVPVSGVAAGGGVLSTGAFAGGGVTCSTGASAAWSASSEHAASRPSEIAAIVIAKGVRRIFITSSLYESLWREAP